LTVTKLDALVIHWRELADVLNAEGCSEVAATRLRSATELENLLHTIESAPLSIAQASEESGYTCEHLRRMLREKPVLNAGRKGRPLVRRRDLPRKAAIKLVHSARFTYDVDADAQSSLVSRQG